MVQRTLSLVLAFPSVQHAWAWALRPFQAVVAAPAAAVVGEEVLLRVSSYLDRATCPFQASVDQEVIEEEVFPALEPELVHD